jgi:hypothetical protein
LHPEVAGRSCDDCKKHIYNEETGVRQEWPKGSGKPMPRPKGTFPPCGYGATKCPKGSPEAGKEWTAENRLAYQYHLECKATGQFPDDAVVRRNAGIIQRIMEQIDRGRFKRMEDLLLASIGVNSKR